MKNIFTQSMEPLFHGIYRVYKRGGVTEIASKIRRILYMFSTSPLSYIKWKRRNNYTRWLKKYYTFTDQCRSNLQQRQNGFDVQPIISVIMPVYNPKPQWLELAIESVKKQIYSNWELCIADDASTDQAVKKILDHYSSSDTRIKVIFRNENGHISAASNSALSLVTGEWLALLDQDDQLSEDALFWVADSINKFPEAGLIYSDEDKISETGHRFHPYFKCDWNQDRFYSNNMISHLGVYKTHIVNEIGGFRVGFEGSQDYDLALRCIEKLEPEQIIHIPRILYHWRFHTKSTSMSSDVKPYTILAGEKALNEHFSRTGVKGKVIYNGIGYTPVYTLPDLLPLVSIIIPIRNGKDLLEKCLTSIFQKTSYPNFEIIIIDNGSDDKDTLKFLQNISINKNLHIIRDNGPFNYSRLNNSAVSMAKGEILALLNNDVEVISPDWLSVMVSHAIRPEIGAVGAKLWYPDNTLQHGGVILGIGGIAGHAELFSSTSYKGYYSRLMLTQNISAVTGACMVVRKNIYLEVGGLNEMDLAVAFNDIDFCLRILHAGYKNVWTPYAELIHHESATRGFEDTAEKQDRFNKEITYMKEKWGAFLQHDPAYSPNLTLEHSDFSLAWPPRINLC